MTRIIAVGAIFACTAIYNSAGINPDALTSFGGSPERAAGLGSLAFVAVAVLIIAPLLEEGVFRLWLSFKKWQVALSAALIPVIIMWQYYRLFSPTQYITCVAAAAIVFAAINYATRQTIWSRLRDTRLVTASWISAAAFGLCHLIAFSTISWTLLPYCLCVLLVPFFGGCACVYLRINAGFPWAVALHAFNNLPALLVIAAIP